MESIEQIKCPNCLTLVTEDVDSCPHCKAEFYNCSDCNALVLENETICKNCNSSLDAEQVDKYSNEIFKTKPLYEYKSLDVLTKILMFLVASAIIFSLLNIYAVANDISFLKANNYIRDDFYYDDPGIYNILIFVSLTFSLFVFIISAIFYFIWVRRAYRNLHTLQTKPTEHSFGWAIGSYFIPIMNLVWPYQIMSEIWFGSQPSYNLEDESNNEFRERRTSTTFLNIWWATFLINGFANNLSSFFTSKADTAQMLITSYWIDIISYVTGIFLCLLILYLVWTINNWQSEKMKKKPTKSCKHCGKQVEFDALLCTHCGK